MQGNHMEIQESQKCPQIGHSRGVSTPFGWMGEISTKGSLQESASQQHPNQDKGGQA